MGTRQPGGRGPRLARMAWYCADRCGFRHSRQSPRLPRLVGAAAGHRDRAVAIGAFGLALSHRAGKPAAGPDRIDQLSALSLALAAIGVFRDRQIRATDVVGERIDAAVKPAAGMGNLPVWRSADSFRPAERAEDRRPVRSDG